MKRYAVPAVLALLAIPMTASAHNATIACDTANPGRYIVQPDYLQLNPVTTFGPTSATVVWSDRYRVVLPYPSGCVAPPPPTPTGPPVVETPPNSTGVIGSPILAPAPPVVAPGAPEPMPRKVAQPRKPAKVTCAYLLKHRAGKWSYVARGFYPFCRAPKPPLKGQPFVPKVTG